MEKSSERSLNVFKYYFKLQALWAHSIVRKKKTSLKRMDEYKVIQNRVTNTPK